MLQDAVEVLLQKNIMEGWLSSSSVRLNCTYSLLKDKGVSRTGSVAERLSCIHRVLGSITSISKKMEGGGTIHIIRLLCSVLLVTKFAAGPCATITGALRHNS